jgi:hypothetical protein
LVDGAVAKFYDTVDTSGKGDGDGDLRLSDLILWTGDVKDQEEDVEGCGDG